MTDKSTLNVVSNTYRGKSDPDRLILLCQDIKIEQSKYEIELAKCSLLSEEEQKAKSIVLKLSGYNRGNIYTTIEKIVNSILSKPYDDRTPQEKYAVTQYVSLILGIQTDAISNAYVKKITDDTKIFTDPVTLIEVCKTLQNESLDQEIESSFIRMLEKCFTKDPKDRSLYEVSTMVTVLADNIIRGGYSVDKLKGVILKETNDTQRVFLEEFDDDSISGLVNALCRNKAIMEQVEECSQEHVLECEQVCEEECEHDHEEGEHEH